MKKPPMMSWGDRFALIDNYNPSNTAICVAFNLTPGELKTALSLREAGTFVPNKNLDVTKYGDIFPDITDDVIQPTESTYTKVGSATIRTRPETATKKSATPKVLQKRGRKGDKIAQALFAVTNTPVPVEQFTQTHNISLAVLRQSKRFTENMSSEDIQKIGKINVRQDKDTKVLMIWREDI